MANLRGEDTAAAAVLTISRPVAGTHRIRPHTPHGPAVRTTDIGDYAPPQHPQGGIQKRTAFAPRPTIIPDGGGYVEGEVDDDDDWYEEGKE